MAAHRADAREELFLLVYLIVSSSTIYKMFEITLFTKIGMKFTFFTKKRTKFSKKCNFCTYFCKKNVDFVPIFVKSVNFEHFVIGRRTQY